MSVHALAWGVSFAVGLLSLSQEIVWVRIVGLGQQGRPQAFALVLVAFLLGIAGGAALGRQVCARARRVLAAGGWALLAAAALDLLALALCSTGLVVTADAPAQLLAVLVLVGLCAAAKGTLFPIVHHLGSRSETGRLGRSVSRVYLANVLGSTLGPLFTGFWLLDVWPMERVMALIALACATLGAVVLWVDASGTPHGPAVGLAVGPAVGPAVEPAVAPLRRPLPQATAVALLVALAGAAVWRPPGVAMRIAAGISAQLPVRHLIQNRHGVLHVLAEDAPGSGDITFGGNAYDGRIAVDTAVNANGLDRAYAMAVLHPHPRRALVVGLSTGAWTAVILGLPGIEAVDVLEINPGYLDLIRRYPQMSPLLADPRVQVHIDDGRRWLRAHPQARYDLVFQNTTWHWRAHTTLLLSREYMQQLRAHLQPGGIVAMNATFSPDVFQTASSVFGHVGRRAGFAYMSDAPLRPRADALAVLRAARVADRPAFAAASFDPGGLADRLAREPVTPAAAFLAQAARQREPRVISDLNLVNEYRHGAEPPLAGLPWLLPADAGPWRQ